MVVSLGNPLDARGHAGPLLRILGQVALEQREHHLELLRVGRGRIRHGAAFSNSTPLCTSRWRRRRRRGSCWGRRGRASRAPARCTTSTPRASRPSTRTPGFRPRRWLRPRGPGSRRCCTRPSAPRRRARSGSRSAPRSARSLQEPMTRAPFSGCWAAYSSRIAIRPGISCSASVISLRPNSASEMSATL